jgi:hypothetical protein
MNNTGFWQKLVGTAYWQVVLVLLTAFTTAFLTYYFTDRSRRKKSLVTARSNVQNYSYLLMQTISNRMQDEIHFNYYQALLDLGVPEERKAAVMTLIQNSIDSMPVGSMKVSVLYAQLLGEVSKIEQLSSKKSYAKVKGLVTKNITEHKSITIAEPNGSLNAEQLKEYQKQAKSALAQTIKNDLRKPLKGLNKQLLEVKLSFL